MKDKMLKKAFSVVIVLAIFAGGVMFLHKKSMEKPYVGRLVFENTYASFNDVREIILNENTTLYLEDNLWRIKEAQGYYANHLLMNELFKIFNRATILQEVSIGEDAVLSELISIKVSKEHDQVMDNAAVFEGNVAELDNRYFFVSGNFDFPREMLYWLQQPLITFDVQDVEIARFISPSGEYTAIRPEVDKPAFLRKLSFLEFYDVKREGDFVAENYPNRLTIKLTFSDGLINVLDIYYNQREYWIKKSLETSILPTKAAIEFAKNNKFLYDGWLFQISPEDGRFIVSQSRKPIEVKD